MNYPFPSSPPFFSGREEHVRILRGLEAGIAVIAGFPGSGKSSLAAAGAPDTGRLWIEVQQGWNDTDLLRALFRALDREQDTEGLRNSKDEDSARIILAIAEEKGLYLVLDDAHELQESLIRCICQLSAMMLKRARVVLLFRELPTFISKSKQDAASGGVNIIMLHPLQRHELNGMIEKIAALQELTPTREELDSVWEYSRGNPLLAKYALGSLLVEGVIPPPGASDEISSVVDGLPVCEREVLDILAVAGMAMPLSIFGTDSALCPEDGHSLATGMARLKRRLLIEEQADMTSIHPALCDYVTPSVESRNRAAELFGRSDSCRPAFAAFRLFLELNRQEEACALAAKWAEQWIAEGFAAHLLKALENDEFRTGWKNSMAIEACHALCLDFTGRYGEALEIYRKNHNNVVFDEIIGSAAPAILARGGKLAEALEEAGNILAGKIPEDIGRICVLLDRSSILSDLGRTAEAYQDCLDAIQLLEKHCLEHGENSIYTQSLFGRACHSAGVIDYNRGDLQSASSWCEKALKALENSGDILGVPRLRGTMAMIKARLGELEEAVELLQKNIRRLEELADYRGMTVALNTLSTVLGALRKTGEAREALNRARDVAGDDPWALAECENFRGNYEYREGFMDEAVKAWQTAIKSYQQLGRIRNVAMIQPKIASAFLIAGRIPEARKAAECALKYGEETGLAALTGRARLFLLAADIRDRKLNTSMALNWAKEAFEQGDRESAAGMSLLAMLCGGDGSMWLDYAAAGSEEPSRIRDIYGFVLRVVAPLDIVFVHDSSGIRTVQSDDDYGLVLGSYRDHCDFWVDYIACNAWSRKSRNINLFKKPKTARLLEVLALRAEPVSLKELHDILGTGKYDPFTSPYKLRTLISRLRKSLKAAEAEGIICTGTEDGTYTFEPGALQPDGAGVLLFKKLDSGHEAGIDGESASSAAQKMADER